MAKQKTSGKSRSNNKTNSRFTLQLGCCDSLHLYFPLSFQSPRFLSTLSVFTACKAWNILKETSRGIDLRRRENCCSRTNTNWCQKLITRLKDKLASDKCLPALKEIWRKRLLRQKRHQSLKIIKRGRGFWTQHSWGRNGSFGVFISSWTVVLLPSVFGQDM